MRRDPPVDTVGTHGSSESPLIDHSLSDNIGSPGGSESVIDGAELDLGYPPISEFEVVDNDSNVSNELSLNIGTDDAGLVDDEDVGADVGCDVEVRPTVLKDYAAWQDEFLCIFRNMYSDEVGR